MTWTTPTHASRHGLADTDHATADCEHCPRKAIKTDMLVYVGALPPGIRARMGLTTERYICDACRERMVVYEQLVSHEELAAGHGAPGDVVAVHRSIDTWWRDYRSQK